MEQVFGAHTQPLMAFKIGNLIQFYETVISRVVGEGSLYSILKELTSLAKDIFFSSLNDLMKKILQNVSPPGMDLLPPPEIRDSLTLLVSP